MSGWKDNGDYCKFKRCWMGDVGWKVLERLERLEMRMSCGDDRPGDCGMEIWAMSNG